ncbi:two-component response regulator ARR11 [Manihot esculenta]|uniref:two-component response regulator ARR11 n=1 Tax=Manihot esculenta TaxID=3983 RepID=UPI000B5D6752|nr:two-component response regulator ARR11 [Manihot esculenta]
MVSSVTRCALAREALHLLHERKDGYDIVISDVNMPDVDVMSVDGEKRWLMRGVQHGACDYLLKPIRMKELRNIWQHAFRKKILEEMETMQMTINGLDQLNNGLFCGEDLTSIKKRKEKILKANMITDILLQILSQSEVGPKKILDLMSVPWLTRENVARHLEVFLAEKYLHYLSRLEREEELKTCVGGIKHSDSPVTGYVTISTQNLINMQHLDVKKRNCGFPGTGLQVQNMEPRNHGSEAKLRFMQNAKEL